MQAQMSSIFKEYGMPKRMLMDNGSAWKTDDYSRQTSFTVWLMSLGIQVTHSRPYHPQTQGKEERLHRTPKIIAQSKDFQQHTGNPNQL